MGRRLKAHTYSIHSHRYGGGEGIQIEGPHHVAALILLKLTLLARHHVDVPVQEYVQFPGANVHVQGGKQACLPVPCLRVSVIATYQKSRVCPHPADDRLAYRLVVVEVDPYAAVSRRRVAGLEVRVEVAPLTRAVIPRASCPILRRSSNPPRRSPKWRAKRTRRSTVMAYWRAYSRRGIQRRTRRAGHYALLEA